MIEEAIYMTLFVGLFLALKINIEGIEYHLTGKDDIDNDSDSDIFTSATDKDPVSMAFNFKGHRKYRHR